MNIKKVKFIALKLVCTFKYVMDFRINGKQFRGISEFDTQ